MPRWFVIPRCLFAVFLCAGFAALAAEGPTSPPSAPLQAVSSLDLPRYMGRWYEIANFPNRFQKQCVANTRAEYSLEPAGTVQVINRCQLANGSTQEAVGRARRNAAEHPAKLEVRFAPAWLSFLPQVWGKYWVIDLDDAYQLVAVSEPQREYLWILSRSPKVDPVPYAALLERLKNKGLDIHKLVLTPQE